MTTNSQNLQLGAHKRILDNNSRYETANRTEVQGHDDWSAESTNSPPRHTGQVRFLGSGLQCLTDLCSPAKTMTIVGVKSRRLNQFTASTTIVETHDDECRGQLAFLDPQLSRSTNWPHRWCWPIRSGNQHSTTVCPWKSNDEYWLENSAVLYGPIRSGNRSSTAVCWWLNLAQRWCWSGNL